MKLKAFSFLLSLLALASIPAHAQAHNISWTWVNDPGATKACVQATDVSCVDHFVLHNTATPPLFADITITGGTASGVTTSYTQTFPTAWGSYSVIDTITLYYRDANGVAGNTTASQPSNTLTFTVSPAAVTNLKAAQQ